VILLSAPLFNITLGGKEKVEDIVESVRDKVAGSAAKATYEGSLFHTETAKKQVMEAYTSAGYEPISFMYAKWLTELNADSTSENLTDEEIEKRAKELMETKQSMVLTGNLISGIGFKPITIEGSKITGELVSSSEYSGHLEKGYLFGKLRPGKQRPFFTGHVYQTDQAMRKYLVENLRGEKF
jgi:hypothetical protein